MGKTIAVVGAGRVGQTLARALRRRGYRIGAVVTSSPRTARQAVRFIGAGFAAANPNSGIAAADIVLLTTPDRRIAEVGRTLARLGANWRGRVVLHTSGAMSSRDLKALRRRGAAVGSCHPIYPFPRPLRSFPRGVVFDVEGTRRAVKEASALARSLGGIPIRLRPRGKVLCHASGSLVAGHLMALLELATRGVIRAGVPRRLAWRALEPLVRQTIEGYARWGRGAWTGPLRRGDEGTVRRHLAALRTSPEPYREVYLALGRAGLKLFGSSSRKATRELEALLKS